MILHDSCLFSQMMQQKYQGFLPKCPSYSFFTNDAKKNCLFFLPKKHVMCHQPTAATRSCGFAKALGRTDVWPTTEDGLVRNPRGQVLSGATGPRPRVKDVIHPLVMADIYRKSLF